MSYSEVECESMWEDRKGDSDRAVYTYSQSLFYRPLPGAQKNIEGKMGDGRKLLMQKRHKVPLDTFPYRKAPRGKLITSVFPVCGWWFFAVGRKVKKKKITIHHPCR